MTVIRTERLVLREITEDDFAAVHAYASKLEVVQYVPWGPNTQQDTRDFIVRTLAAATAEPRSEFVYAVELAEAPRMLGTVGLYFRSADTDQAMLGYAYGTDAWGRGIATEAALAMLEVGFDVLGLRRIWASCDPDNAGSRRVLEKCGMTLEGHLRADTLIRGEVRDTLVWGILEPEWRDSSASASTSGRDG